MGIGRWTVVEVGRQGSGGEKAAKRAKAQVPETAAAQKIDKERDYRRKQAIGVTVRCVFLWGMLD